MTDLNSTFDTLWQFATEFCAEVRDFQPDLILVLMHSGWLPFFAGRELWNRVETAPLPPVVCTNLGREKIGIFDNAVKNPHGLTGWFIGGHESAASIAFFLAWLAEKTTWPAELKVQIQEQLGEKLPRRILIVDEFIYEGGTSILTVGLLNQLYPSAQTRFLEAGLSWQAPFWEAWVETTQPQLLETEIFGPPPGGQIQHPLWQAGRQVALGSADILPESLSWQKITLETPLLQNLIPFLPAETWLTLPAWVEAVVHAEIIQRSRDYLVLPLPPRKRYPILTLKHFLLRELFLHGSLSLQQVSQTFHLSKRQARRALLGLEDEGLLLGKEQGRVKCFMSSPILEYGYWERPRPFLDCYWAVPGQLLVGEFPGWDLEHDHETLLPRLEWLLEQGVTFFLDLSERYQCRPNTYQRLLELKAAEKGLKVIYRSRLTPMQNLPPRAHLIELLDMLDKALAGGQVIYLPPQSTGWRHRRCTRWLLAGAAWADWSASHGKS